jgi:K(+)-stimulated pyrophosphate-energized sodium pump
MGAVGRAAAKIVEDVRRRFREIPGIMEGINAPGAAGSVRIAADGAIREMILPGTLAVAVFVGVVLGAEALGGLLIGSISSGAPLALMVAEAGGAWDNAKKHIEKDSLEAHGNVAVVCGPLFL